MKPTVGRIVHYVSHGTPIRVDGTQAFASQCRAAIVTEVVEGGLHPPYVRLAVLNPEGMFFTREALPYDEWNGNTALEGALPQGGSWHWPERE